MIGARRALSGNGPFLFGSPIAAGDALAFAISQDGSLLATGRRDGTIQLIDTALRRPVGPSLRRHQGSLQDVAFAPDGRPLVSAGADGALLEWTGADGLGNPPRNVAPSLDVDWGLRSYPAG